MNHHFTKLENPQFSFVIRFQSNTVVIMFRSPLLMLFALFCTVVTSAEQANIRGSELSKARELQDNSTDFTFSTGTIVGGTQVPSGEAPWFVHFGSGACGGSLISESAVLTAAHCVYDSRPTTVRVGATSQSDGTVVDVLCANIHPNYDGEVKNDLAVLKLRSSVPNPSVVTLNANTGNPSAAGQTLTVIGKCSLMSYKMNFCEVSFLGSF